MWRKILVLGGAAMVLLGALVVTVVLVIGGRRLGETEVTPGLVSPQAGTYLATIDHGGRVRRYLLHVPPAAKDLQPLPLLVLLHGGGGTGDRIDDLTGMIAIADREGFLVALPDGVDKNWNDGRDDVRSTAHRENVDDVGFIRAMIDDVAAKTPVETRRVYAAGISNGAIMSSRLACEASDRIAAVGLVVGTAPEGFEETCRPVRPVPVIAFLGTDDPLVPYEGGPISAVLSLIDRGRVVSAEALKQFWARHNGCAEPAAVAELPDITTADNSRVVREAFGGCSEGADVVFYRIDGGGHTWPGGKQYLSPWLVGTTNRDVSASELIWRFFAAHAMP